MCSVVQLVIGTLEIIVLCSGTYMGERKATVSSPHRFAGDTNDSRLRVTCEVVLDAQLPTPATSVVMRPVRAPLQPPLLATLSLLMTLLLLLTSSSAEADEGDGADGGHATAVAEVSAAPVTAEPRVFAFRKGSCAKTDDGTDILCAIVRIVNDAARKREPKDDPEDGPKNEVKEN